jgi:threonine synthase
MRLRCTHCGSITPWPTGRWACPCGGPREVIDLPDFVPDAVDSSQPGLWRYRAMLPPVPASGVVTLGEGFTPLMSSGSSSLSTRPVHSKIAAPP